MSDRSKVYLRYTALHLFGSMVSGGFLTIFEVKLSIGVLFHAQAKERYQEPVSKSKILVPN